MNLRSQYFIVMSTEKSEAQARPLDCSDLKDFGFTRSGHYDIYPYLQSGVSDVPVKVWCDMDTEEGGWTVGFQSMKTYNNEK